MNVYFPVTGAAVILKTRHFVDILATEMLTARCEKREQALFTLFPAHPVVYCVLLRMNAAPGPLTHTWKHH